MKLYYGILEAITEQLAKAPVEDDISIELDVVPKDYQEIFRELCDGGRLSARAFSRR